MFVWVGAFGQTSLRNGGIGVKGHPPGRHVSVVRRKILVQSDSEAERLKGQCLWIFRDYIPRFYGTFPNKKNDPGLCMLGESYLKYAGTNLCQSTPSRASGKTRLYQKPVMERQVCDWWRYHLPPGRSSGCSLTNNLMPVFASKRKWHESRAGSSRNMSQMMGITLDFYLY